MKKLICLFMIMAVVFGLGITALAYDDYDPRISFDANGGTGTMETVYMNGNFKLPECGFTAPEGFQFKHWYVQGHTPKYPGDTVYVDDRIVAKAIWEKIPAKVVFENGGGVGTMDEVEIFGDYTLPECTFTAPEGQQFKGWQINDAEKQPGDMVYVDGIISVTALWEQSLVKVTFNSGDGTGTMEAVEVYGDYVLPDCTFTAPEGQQFKCWIVNNQEKKPGENVNIECDTTVNALWENVPDEGSEIEKTVESNQDNGTDSIDSGDLWLIIAIAAAAVILAVAVTLLIVKKRK